MSTMYTSGCGTPMRHDPLVIPEYTYPRRRTTDIASQVCMAILVVIIAWTILCIVHLIVNPKAKHRSPFLSSMLTKFRSARQSSEATVATEDAYVPDVGPCHNITQCRKDDPLCADWKTVDDTVRKKNEAALRKFIKDSGSSVVFFYAPWCPHCSAAMPGFVNASKRVRIPSAIVNAELLPKESISGEGAVVQITHFPFVCRFGTENSPPVVLNDVSEDAIVTATSESALAEGAESKISLDAFFH
jgi:thiol-disulfide isomerase/thioredoxin